MCEANLGPTATHEEILKHLFRYIYGTRDLNIRLRGKYDRHGFNPRVYADALFADDLVERLPTAGHIVFLGDVPILWKSKKQTIVAASSTEAEFMNLTSAGMSVI